jgi:hypothetical protein
VVGGTTWPVTPQNFGNDGPPNPSHSDAPGNNDAPKNPPVQFAPTDNFAATPEPTYVGLTGIAFAGLAILAMKRRRSINQTRL